MLGLTYHFQSCYTPTISCQGNYCNPKFTGWYFGVSAGDVITRAKIGNKVACAQGLVTPEILQVETLTPEVNASNNNIIGQVAFGY